MEDLLRRLGLDLTAFANRLRDWLREPKAARTPADGEVLTWDADDGTWGPEPVPESDSGVQIAQDLGGTKALPVVIGLQTVGVDATAPNDGDVLTYDSGTGTWGPAPPPFSGHGWGIIYDVDFTTLPSQNTTSSGSYTIDGYQWWAKGALAATQTTELLNGSGLRLTTPSAESASLTAGTNLGHRMYAFDVSQVPGYNPAAPWVALWRITGTAPLNAGIAAQAGVCNATPLDATQFLAADWAGMFTLSTVDTASSAGRYQLPSSTAGVTVSPSVSTTIGDWAYGMMTVNGSARVALWSAWSAGFPTIDNMNRSYLLAQQASTAPVFCYCHRKTTNGIGDLVTYLTNFRLLQPTEPL